MYLDRSVGTGRPPGYPFALNSAVNTLLKKEFDILRAKNKKHPLIEEYGVDAIPVEHENLDEWRENFKGITCEHKETGFTISGAVDDVWISPKKELHVVDYKATSKDTTPTLDAEWQDGYKRQKEV